MGGSFSGTENAERTLPFMFQIQNCCTVRIGLFLLDALFSYDELVSSQETT